MSLRVPGTQGASDTTFSGGARSLVGGYRRVVTAPWREASQLVSGQAGDITRCCPGSLEERFREGGHHLQRLQPERATCSSDVGSAGEHHPPCGGWDTGPGLYKL